MLLYKLHVFCLVAGWRQALPGLSGLARAAGTCSGVRLGLRQSHWVQAPGEGAQRALQALGSIAQAAASTISSPGVGVPSAGRGARVKSNGPMAISSNAARARR